MCVCVGGESLGGCNGTSMQWSYKEQSWRNGTVIEKKLDGCVAVMRFQSGMDIMSLSFLR